VSRETIDALEAYHEAGIALREATPGTSDWIRLRMIAEARRSEYERLLGADERAIMHQGGRVSSPSADARVRAAERVSRTPR
jgi:hypothetical protein